MSVLIRGVGISFLAISIILLFTSSCTAVNMNIDYGSPMAGSITPGGVDTYTFTAGQGDAVVIRIVKTKGDMYPRITLYGPTGSEISRRDGSATAEIFSQLEDEGAYRILVDDGSRDSKVGTYSLFVQCSNAPQQAMPLDAGTATSESIAAAGEIDTYSFNAAKGEANTIRISKTDGEFGPWITLYGPDGNEVRREWSSTTSEISSVSKMSGVYTILVEDSEGTRTGEYSLFRQITSGSSVGGAVQGSSAGTGATTRRTLATATTSGAAAPTNGAPTVAPGGSGSSSPDYVMLMLVAAGVALIGGIVITGRKRGKPAQQRATPTRTPIAKRVLPSFGRRRSNAEGDHPLPAVISRDVMISYSEADRQIADEICAGLESHGIYCWIAPRNILHGGDFLEEIVDAINKSTILVLVFSSHSNESKYVKREVTVALDKNVTIIPFRIEDVLPSKNMELLLCTAQWLDAFTPPLKNHVETLANTVRIIMENKKRTANSK